MRLVLAFDTATHVATVAVLRDGEVVGECSTRSQRVLADADEILASFEASPRDVTALVVGTGPGSFTGTRLGLALARGFALARDVPVAGVSTLAALAAGSPGAVPVIDAGRREVFSLVGEVPRAGAAGLVRGKANALRADDQPRQMREPRNEVREPRDMRDVRRGRRHSLQRRARGAGSARAAGLEHGPHPAREAPRELGSGLRSRRARRADLRPRA